MNTDEDALEIHDVQLPLTRPNLFVFIPYELAVVFGTLFFALDTQFHSWKIGFSVLPLWSGAAILTKRDYNGVRVFLTRLRLMPTMFDSFRWGGATVAPFPAKPSRFRGMRDAP